MPQTPSGGGIIAPPTLAWPSARMSMKALRSSVSATARRISGLSKGGAVRLISISRAVALQRLLTEREETIRDLRARLDAEGEERRRVQAQLTGLLTNNRSNDTTDKPWPRRILAWLRRSNTSKRTSAASASTVWLPSARDLSRWSGLHDPPLEDAGFELPVPR
jgi:hypothetical protein